MPPQSVYTVIFLAHFAAPSHHSRMLRILALTLTVAAPAQACDTALLLAIDVSGSIDRGEYALQVQGLADALQDPAVAEVLLQGQVALAVVQWSGLGSQKLVMPWTRMLSARHITDFAATARSLPRAFSGSDTAVGEAISFSIEQFNAVPDCKRHVIDVSGDGPENAGYSVGQARSAASAKSIDINAIAIEDMGNSAPTTSFYRNWVITPKGFAMTARGLGDYPRAIREKLLRELIKPIG
jgi:Ca-activated chloride channel family protein